MKIAILNLANNVKSFSTTPSGETIYLKRVFEKLGHSATIISNNETDNTISFESVGDINDYDKLIVVNGAINFFGGTKNPTILNNFKLMAHFKKPILYFLTDARLPFRQLWPKIQSREWGITEEDSFVSSPIIIVSQTRNLDVIEEIHKDIPSVSKIVHFPIEQYKLIVDADRDYSNVTKTCDLIYGGSYRAGSRENKMIEYLFDTSLDVVFFGTAREKQFKSQYSIPPIFSQKVSMDKFSEKTSEGIASIIIGDKIYNGNHITLRVWETMMSDAVCFIDLEFDPNQEILGTPFYYVSSKQELVDKIKLIKEEETFRKDLVKYQRQRVNELFDKDKYLSELEGLLYEN